MTVKELLGVLANVSLENEDAMNYRVMVVLEHESNFLVGEVKEIDEGGLSRDLAVILLSRSIGEYVAG